MCDYFCQNNKYIAKFDLKLTCHARDAKVESKFDILQVIIVILSFDPT